MKVSSRKGGGSVFVPYVSNFSYAASGGISQMRLGNGRWETAKFNDRMQVTELGLGASATDAGVWKTNYEYGELQTNGTVDTTKNTGNIAKQILSFSGLAHPLVQSYKYDSLYRITEAKETANGSQNWVQNWGYDRYGNRTGFTQNIGGLTTAPNPTIDANTNRFNGSQGFSYDKNGNVVNDIDPITSLGRQFIFNGDNKQTEVKKDSVTIGRYYYDGEGKRVKKVTDTETTVFVYSGGKLIAEYSTNVAPFEDAKVAYTTTDHLGTPRVITDQFGVVVSRRDFLPFGEEIHTGVGARSTTLDYGSDDKVRQKFIGYQKDNETSLDFAEARMYENRLGRFTAVDPLLASGKSANPQTFNRYAYTSNNPVVRIDKNGLEWYYTFEKSNGRDIARPKWCDGFGCSSTYSHKWGTSVSSTEGNRTTVWRTSFAYANTDNPGTFTALDRYENRGISTLSSLSDAQSQVDAWNRQAAVNFIAGALSGYSLIVDFTGAAKGMTAETDSNMFAMGQRAGTGGSLATLFTGASLLNLVGKSGTSVLKGLSFSTGTVWDSVKATQGIIRGSVIPTSFELTTRSGKFWVHGNATKHFAEFAAMKAVNSTPEAVRLASQIQLASFHSAVSAAAKNGIKYDEVIEIGGWELIFGAPRQAGQNPVVYHARYLH